MAELKTKKNDGDVLSFLESVQDEVVRKDCMTLLTLLKKITKQEAKMWGSRIVGFGTYHYKSPKTSREGDWFMTGFSPGKQNLTIYIIPGFKAFDELMQKLGKHKTSVSCLYIKKLADVDSKVLKELITRSFNYMKEKHKIIK